MKCPHCRARLAWKTHAAQSRRAWPIAAGVILLALLAVGTVVWLSVLREVRAPTSPADESAKAARRSAAECAELIAALSKSPSDPRASAALRQCLEKR